jgi:hypothetical protein
VSLLRRLGTDGLWIIRPEHDRLDRSLWTPTTTPPTLAALQAAVGGYVELVRLDEKVLLGWINEEGKLKGLPDNPLATALCYMHDALDVGDYIAGPMVITVGRACPD